MSRHPTDPLLTGTESHWDRVGRPGACAGGLAGLMALALAPGVPSPVRAVVAVAFFVAAPGLAWIRALPVDGLVERAAVVVALSLAVDVVVAEALLYAGVTGVAPVFASLVAVVAGGIAVTTTRRSEASP